jgi:hypothetical protein
VMTEDPEREPTRLSEAFALSVVMDGVVRTEVEDLDRPHVVLVVIAGSQMIIGPYPTAFEAAHAAEQERLSHAEELGPDPDRHYRVQRLLTPMTESA